VGIFKVSTFVGFGGFRLLKSALKNYFAIFWPLFLKLGEMLFNFLVTLPRAHDRLFAILVLSTKVAEFE
jgi:hypothetical protein